MGVRPSHAGPCNFQFLLTRLLQILGLGPFWTRDIALLAAAWLCFEEVLAELHNTPEVFQAGDMELFCRDSVGFYGRECTTCLSSADLLLTV